jgi:hypothetical protein
VAIGFPAQHRETVALSFPLTDERVSHACHVLGWHYHGRFAEGPQGVTWHLTVSTTLTSLGEEVSVMPLGPGEVEIKSRCVMPAQWVDWGKNRQNVLCLRNILFGPIPQASQAIEPH